MGVIFPVEQREIDQRARDRQVASLEAHLAAALRRAETAEKAFLRVRDALACYTAISIFPELSNVRMAETAALAAEIEARHA